MFLTDPKNDRLRIGREKGSRVDGTCEWIKSHHLYKSWFNSTSQLLWLSGGPGKGKTMLSVFIAEDFERIAKRSDNKITFLQYFCDDKDEKRRTATCIVRGLLLQLLQIVPHSINLLLPSFKIQKQNLFQPSSFETLWNIFAEILRDPLLGTTYCVLDGLDECEASSIEILLYSIASLFDRKDEASPAPRFNLLMFSREHPEIIPETLSDFPRIRLHPDANTEVQADIDRFISTTVEDLSAKKQYPAILRKHVEDVFRERARGTFLWVGIVAKALNRCKISEVEKTLEQFPSDLYGLYDRMLLQIEPDRRKIAVRLIRWIVTACRPLRVEELANALHDSKESSHCLNYEDVIKDQVSYCGDLVVLEDDYIVLVHQSTKDYFLRESSPPNAVLELFRVQKQAADQEIAQVCFHHIECSLATDTRENRREFLDSEPWPFLQYAVLYWPNHVSSFTDAKSILDLSPVFFQEGSNLRKRWLASWWKLHGRSGKAPKSWTVLQLASCLGILPLVKQILSGRSLFSKAKHSRATERVDSRGETALMLALQTGQVSVIRLLLEKGASVNDKDGDGNPTLMYAILIGDKCVLQMLLEKGANVEQKSKEGMTALIYAIILGRMDIVQLLMKKGANLEQKTETGVTVLLSAIFKRRRDIIQLLVEKGVNIEEKSNRGMTPLMYTGSRGDIDIVQLLMEKGANLEQKNEKGRTALMCAVLHERIDTVQLLVQKGANLEQKDENGKSALMFAAGKKDSKMLQLLLEKGADINQKDEFGATALSHAALGNNPGRVQLLIEKGADVRVRDQKGATPLHWMASHGDGQTVQLLLAKGADSDIQDEHGSTALMYAILQRQVGSMRVLLEKDADANIENKNGLTALHVAAFRGYEKGVQLLLEKGADSTIKTETGLTASDVALRKGHESIAELIKSYQLKQT